MIHPERVIFDMSIYLCSRYIGMTEQFLDRTEIGASGKQMCRERMPEGMNLGFDARKGLDILKSLPDAFTRKTGSTVVYEEGGGNAGAEQFAAGFGKIQ